MSPAKSMVSIDEIRAVARRRFDRDARVWAATGDSDATLEVVLHPPTEAAALRDQAAAIAWARSWRAAPFDADVVWEDRRWASLGTQSVPVRVVLHGAAVIAAAASATPAWRRLENRTLRIRQSWLPSLDPERSARVVLALRTESARILSLDDPDFDRFLAVVDWLVAHPGSGHYLRQLPIRGIHTKWLAAHRAVVSAFVFARTGGDTLGLAENPGLIRVRFLDPSLAPGGVADLAAPAATLAALTICPTTVFLFENLESVVAMPTVPGAVVVHGSGYAVDRLRDVPWIRDGRIVYWGDLDSHGFAILNQARAACSDVTSVLMDADTLAAFRDLAGTEPTPTRSVFSRLTGAEANVLAALGSDGDVRLEQERIGWQYALERLRRAAAVVRSDAGVTPPLAAQPPPPRNSL